MNAWSTLTHLSDQQLLLEVKTLAARERDATAALVAALAEVDARRLYLGEGCSSLFTYCTQILRLSEHAAYGRIAAARAARKFPLVVDLLAEGSVTLTTICLLAPVLSADNHVRVLDDARGKSKREVERLVASMRPQPALPTLVLPLAPEIYKIQFTMSADMHDRLRRAQDLLRHVVPDGDPATIFDRALTLLLNELEKTKHAATSRPIARRDADTTPRRVPAAVKRQVWARDSGRCAFVGTSGRCIERGFLEYHHVVPYAAGGSTTAENIELRCRAHNQHEADMFFGPMIAREARAAFSGPGRQTRNVPKWGSTRSGPSPSTTSRSKAYPQATTSTHPSCP